MREKETFWDYYDDTVRKASDFLHMLFVFFMAFLIFATALAAVVAMVVSLFQWVGLWTLAILSVPVLIFGGPYLVAYVRWRRAKGGVECPSG